MSGTTLNALDALMFYSVILLVLLVGAGIGKLIAMLMEELFKHGR